MALFCFVGGAYLYWVVTTVYAKCGKMQKNNGAGVRGGGMLQPAATGRSWLPESRSDVRELGGGI